MKKAIETIVTVSVVYTIGLALGLILWLFKKTKKVVIVNPQNLPENWLEKSPLVIVANHPDILDCMYEVFLLPGLLYPQVLKHPLKMAPKFTPDKRNFTDKKHWFWLKPFAVSVPRRGDGLVVAARKLQAIAQQGISMIFFEPGRTRNGEYFVISKSGKRRIRIPSESVAMLAKRAKNVQILPIWMEEKLVSEPQGNKPKLFSRPQFNRGAIIVKIGEIIRFSDSFLAQADRSEVNERIIAKLLELADQE